MKKFQPLRDKVLISPQAVESVTTGGIILPEASVEKTQFGTVVSLGRGELVNGEIIPFDFEVGDTVMYAKYGGNEITLDGEVNILLAARDIHGKVTEQ